jgi:hypothetical protein
MTNILKFTGKKRAAVDSGIIADTMICADWAFGGVAELLRRMNDDESQTIYLKSYQIFDASADVINPENEALITLIDCERERRGWDDGGTA